MAPSGLLLRIENRHSASAGAPPAIDGGDPQVYVGYFENSHGEQWVFTYHRASGRAELRGGDAGWGNPFEVREGTVEELVLAPEEVLWLRACWRAAAGVK